MRFFLLDVDASGNDPMTDRIIQIAAINPMTNETFFEVIRQNVSISMSVTNPLSISPSTISNARKFGQVIQDLFSWMNTDLEPHQPIYICAPKGHRFVFPLLTKEMRRYKIPIQRVYALWDFLYTFNRLKISADTPPEMNCIKRLEAFAHLFKQGTGFSIADQEGFLLLKRDNEAYISQNPQSIFQTKYLRVN